MEVVTNIRHLWKNTWQVFSPTLNCQVIVKEILVTSQEAKILTLLRQQTEIQAHLPEILTDLSIVRFTDPTLFNQRLTKARGYTDGFTSLADRNQIELNQLATKYLIMPKIVGCNLEHIFQREFLNQPNHLARRWDLADQIILVVEALQKAQVQHNDCNVGNIILVKDDNYLCGYRFVLLDFGESMITEEEKDYSMEMALLIALVCPMQSFRSVCDLKQDAAWCHMKAQPASPQVDFWRRMNWSAFRQKLEQWRKADHQQPPVFQ